MGKIQLTTVQFLGTAKQEQLLRSELDVIKGMDGALMPALQCAQDIYGYLPIEVQKIVAEVLDVSLEKVFGIVTFYSQFNLNPKGKYSISVCLGTACYVKGSAEIIARFERELKCVTGACTKDGKFSITATRCIGCCGLAPVATINEEVFGKMKPEDVPGICAKYNAL